MESIELVELSFMIGKMISEKCRQELFTVIVIDLFAVLDGKRSSFTRFEEYLGTELIVVPFVRRTLINQNRISREGTIVDGNQLGGVIGFPMIDIYETSELEKQVS